MIAPPLQAVTSAAPASQPAASSAGAFLRVPSHWPGQGDLLDWCQSISPLASTVLVIAGLIYLAYGWKAFKGLVTLNAAFVGAFIGALLGQRGGNWFGGACVGAFIVAAIAFPMMKYAVAFMGGAFGALLGAATWRTAGLDPNLAWAGALSGLIAFGMLSFILFRGSVIMYTSLQGSVMLIFGLLGLIYKYQSLGPELTRHMQLKPFMLPLAIFIPAMLGLIYQQTAHPPPPEPKKK